MHTKNYNTGRNTAVTQKHRTESKVPEKQTK